MQENPVLHKRSTGIWIMASAFAMGFIISLINFFSPTSPIAHTGGVELVATTSFAMFILSLALHGFRHLPARWERISIYIILFILIAGSLFAALLLESWWLFTFLWVAFLGWLIQIFSR